MRDRDRIRSAFRRLRSRGFVARMNFSCCSGCACAELEHLGVKAGDDVAYYHEQDAEAFDDRGMIAERGGSLMIRHSGDTYAIVGALSWAGLHVEWDGDTATCIEVRSPGL